MPSLNPLIVPPLVGLISIYCVVSPADATIVFTVPVAGLIVIVTSFSFKLCTLIE